MVKSIKVFWLAQFEDSIFIFSFSSLQEDVPDRDEAIASCADHLTIVS